MFSRVTSARLSPRALPAHGFPLARYHRTTSFSVIVTDANSSTDRPEDMKTVA